MVWNDKFSAGLIRIGYRKPLVQEDLWDISHQDEASSVCGRFRDLYEGTQQRSQSPKVCHKWDLIPYIAGGGVPRRHIAADTVTRNFTSWKLNLGVMEAEWGGGSNVLFGRPGAAMSCVMGPSSLDRYS